MKSLGERIREAFATGKPELAVDAAYDNSKRFLEDSYKLHDQIAELKSENEGLKQQLDRSWAEVTAVARKSVVSGIFRRFGIRPALATASSEEASKLLKDRLALELAQWIDTIDSLIRNDDAGVSAGFAASILISLGRTFGIELTDPRLSPEARQALEDSLKRPTRRQLDPSELEAEDGDEKLLEEAANALIFCSGSYDFGPEGQAKEGWDKLCRPVLTKLLVRLPVPKANSDVDPVDTDPKT